MNKASKLVALTAGMLATATLFSAASQAKDEEPVTQNTMTVWVDGKGHTGFAELLNKIHAEMETKGWKFGDLEIYTENGDMQGAFVTYVR